jgi:lysophospholipase L1-like esterase
MVLVASLVSLAIVALADAHDANRAEHWVSTWATAQQISAEPPPPAPDTRSATGKPVPPSPIVPFPSSLKNQTVRMVVRVSIGGPQIRVQLSNAQGRQPLKIGVVHIARHARDSSIEPGSDRSLTFGGESQLSLPPGAIVVSDPVDLPVDPLGELAVSLYVPEDSGPVTVHPLGLRTTYIAEGNVAAKESLAGASQNRSDFWLSSIDVLAPKASAAVVAFGDSITDGFATTAGAEQAWPALLAKKLGDRKHGPSRSVLNLGISGNRVLHDGAGASALARFDRDVLSRPGVRWMILLEGINDISFAAIPGVPAEERIGSTELISGLRLLIEKAHLHGIKVMGATILPWEGVWTFSEAGEATRQAVNHWIRSSGAYDAVVDFDAITRDSVHPKRLRAQFDSGDHVHPNDAGNRAMADAVDIRKLTQ